MSAPAAFQLGRLPKTDDELWWTVKLLWNVELPRQQVCPDHVAPFTAFCDAYFARNSIDPESPIDSMALWHGSRGLSGKSFMLSILGLTEAFLLGTKINLLGGSLAQSASIHEHMREAMYSVNAPRYMVMSEGNTSIVLSNGARIRPLTASQKTVRGPHPSRILLDEIDEMELAILDAALGQPMRQRNYQNNIIKPFTVMCSTWQNPDGTFTEIMKRAEATNIPVYAWCFRETANPIDGWLTEDAIEEKKRTIPAEMWRVEYELGEPSIGNRAFDSTAVEEAFSLDIEPIYQRKSKDFEEFRFAEPIRDATYVAGADWAKERDYTVISVARVDKYPHELVYFIRVNRRPYPVMINYLNEAINKYGAQAEHDATGLGNVIGDLLDGRARNFLMQGIKRANMLSEFVAAVERGKWRYPKALKTAYSEMKYCQVGDLYSNTLDYHLPDTVCAFGLMEHVAKRLAPAVSPVMLKKDAGAINAYQKMFEVHDPEAFGTRQEGTVVQMSEEPTALSLLS